MGKNEVFEKRVCGQVKAIKFLQVGKFKKAKMLPSKKS